MTANNAFELDVTYNYGFVGNNEAYYLANFSDHSATVTNVVDSDPMQYFGSLNLVGKTDQAVLPSRPWHGIFTINEGGIISRWDVTVADGAGSAGDVVVCSTGSIGPIQVFR